MNPFHRPTVSHEVGILMGPNPVAEANYFIFFGLHNTFNKVGSKVTPTVGHRSSTHCDPSSGN
ncbi:hypothetical protein FRX31_022419 [Thalictrum thalictroides]|uniref:Uncharacterized protein n=1 Tax=Thalictrum thalictroides TaxID=46969 RepID=A0A7J6VSC7_THATH|nr:hypothetical protein FRX31_022419 [Thalictrum thalictroides]